MNTISLLLQYFLFIIIIVTYIFIADDEEERYNRKPNKKYQQEIVDTSDMPVDYSLIYDSYEDAFEALGEDGENILKGHEKDFELNEDEGKPVNDYFAKFYKNDYDMNRQETDGYMEIQRAYEREHGVILDDNDEEIKVEAKDDGKGMHAKNGNGNGHDFDNDDMEVEEEGYGDSQKSRAD